MTGFTGILTRMRRATERRQGGDAQSASGSEPAPRWSEGDAYEGARKQGRPHGKGKLVRPDGAVCTGIFVHGELSRGTIRFPDGVTYEGPCRNFVPHGVGRFAYVSPRARYQGQVVDGKRDGRGRFEIEGVGVYDGPWHNGLAGAQSGCHFRYDNGDEYSGGWDEDRRDGEGTYWDRTLGVRVHGRFEDDAWPTRGEWRHTGSDCSWQGGLNEKTPHGLGTMTHRRDGLVWRGAMTDGVAASWGACEVQKPRACTFEGSLTPLGRPGGRGTCTWPAEGLTFKGVVAADDWGLQAAWVRAKLGALRDSLRDGYNKAFEPGAARLLPCKHADSIDHLQYLKRHQAARLRRDKTNSAEQTYVCFTCRAPIETLPQDLPRDARSDRRLAWLARHASQAPESYTDAALLALYKNHGGALRDL